MPAKTALRLAPTARWFGRRKQRLLYAAAAAALLVAVAAATLAGVLLRHAANLERQALRTQELAGSVVQLHTFSLRLAAEGTSAGLAAGRARALANSEAAFRAVRTHDRAESDRIRPALDAYVAESTRDFRQAASSTRPSPAEQRRLERQLSRLESAINVEIAHLARDTRVTNPEARLALMIAAAAAALLVGLLIWQFEVQRRAGRIDRDNAARAEELSRLRADFVGSVSHELRTPLTSIIGYLELLDDGRPGDLTAEQQAHLDVVQRNAARLHELVRDLLQIAEADGGGLALELEQVDLGALAAACVESAQPMATAKQIELTQDHGSRVLVEGDPLRLEQMINNLLTNAIKFTPADGRVGVRTDLEHDHVLVEVTDTGPGIDPADQSKLFDRFFRSRTAIDQASRGVGLGLAITKTIVDAHRGTITVLSKPGHGSTFRVLLPANAGAGSLG